MRQDEDRTKWSILGEAISNKGLIMMKDDNTIFFGKHIRDSPTTPILIFSTNVLSTSWHIDKLCFPKIEKWVLNFFGNIYLFLNMYSNNLLHLHRVFSSVFIERSVSGDLWHKIGYNFTIPVEISGMNEAISAAK